VTLPEISKLTRKTAMDFPHLGTSSLPSNPEAGIEERVIKIFGGRSSSPIGSQWRAYPGLFLQTRVVKFGEEGETDEGSNSPVFFGRVHSILMGFMPLAQTGAHLEERKSFQSLRERFLERTSTQTAYCGIPEQAPRESAKSFLPFDEDRISSEAVFYRFIEQYLEMDPFWFSGNDVLVLMKCLSTVRKKDHTLNVKVGGIEYQVQRGSNGRLCFRKISEMTAPVDQIELRSDSRGNFLSCRVDDREIYSFQEFSETVGIIINAFFRKALDKSSFYGVAPTGENIRVKLVDRALQVSPKRHLGVFSRCLDTGIRKASQIKVQIKFLDDELLQRSGGDEDSLLREYLNKLLLALTKDKEYFVGIASLFVPAYDQSKVLDKEGVFLYECLGKLLMYCRNSERNSKTSCEVSLGRWFSNETFQSMFLFKSTDLDNPIEHLGLEKHLKFCQIQASADGNENGEKLFKVLQKTLSNPPSDEEVEDLISFFNREKGPYFIKRMETIFADGEERNTLHLLRTNWKEVVTFSLRALRNDPDSVFNKYLNRLAPHFLMARGMRSMILPGRITPEKWEENVAWETLRETDFVRFSFKTQGRVNYGVMGA
jgi:hypothetical protein